MDPVQNESGQLLINVCIQVHIPAFITLQVMRHTAESRLVLLRHSLPDEGFSPAGSLPYPYVQTSRYHLSY